MRSRAAVLAAALALCAAPAGATIMSATWSGDWDGWVDVEGIVSPPGSTFPAYGSIPQSYWSATVYYDTDLGSIAASSLSGYAATTLSWNDPSAPSPFIGAIVTVSAYNACPGAIYICITPSPNPIGGSVTFAFHGGPFQITRNVNGDVSQTAGGLSLIYDRPGVGTGFPVDQTTDYLGPYFFGTYFGAIPHAPGWAHIHSVNIAEVDVLPDAILALPEPSTWVMLILGFGGVGALLRRRRGALAAAC